MPVIPDSRVLIVATDGFEEWELFGPRQILQQRGAEVVLASLKLDPIQATIHDDPGKTIRPDILVDQANADDFDALILPGGVRNPDTLRLHGNVIALIRAFAQQDKPIGAICHGPWLLVEADLLRGRSATSWPSIRTDLRNAGAGVVDEPALSAYGGGASALAFLLCSRVFTAARRKPHFPVPVFDLREVETFESGDELLLTDADRLRPVPGQEEPLVLDDILAEIGPDARVVRLFD